jgi:putative isomerase
MKEYTDLKKRLASGWNTWNTRSVLSHVLLPEGISINLGFKHYAGGDYLKEVLIGRRGENDERIHPGIRSYDGSYTDLRIDWKGCSWRVQTAADGDEIVFLITPLKVKEPRAPLVVAEIGLLWNRPGSISKGEQGISANTPARSIALYGTTSLVEEPYVWAQGPYLCLPCDRPVGFSTVKDLDLMSIQQRIESARAVRLKESAGWKDLAEVRDAMQTCLAWNTLYDPLHDRVISPVSRIWNCNWGGYVMFCWDSYFAAAMAAVDNKDLAYANAIEVTREGMENGFVPNFVSPSGYQSRDRSQPPVGSLIAIQIYERYGEKWFLEEMFDSLLQWNRWWPEARQIEGLLAWGSTPYEPVVGNAGEMGNGVNDRFGAALESGLDNAPMYDDIPFDTRSHLLMLQDVGLNALFIRDCEALSEIAEILGRTGEANELRERAREFRHKMQSLWSEEAGLFLNRRADTHEFSPRLSPTHFYPLLAGVASAEQAGRMIQEHFFNPEEFWGEWILPSCARNDPAYPEQEYWRGRIWAPMNFLVYLGLLRYDLPEARRELVERSKALLLKEWHGSGHIHENYCGDTGHGCNAERSDAFYHWGGLLGLIALMEAESLKNKEPMQ